MSKHYFFRFLFLLNISFLSSYCIAQVQMTPIHVLNQPLVECSGLIAIDGHFIMHNDSGDNPFLYEIDTLTGNFSRRVFISNATNVDWEDICRDESFIYISDTGNNAGVRTDLKIYKVPITDFQSSNSAQAEIIHIAYADQSDFSGVNEQHNFDAEAIISLGDSLYLFSKNRGNGRSKIYPVSKEPGDYILEKKHTLIANGLVTGATYVADLSMVVLTAYTSTTAFLIQLSGFEDAEFADADMERYTIEMAGSFQIESIAWKGDGKFITATEGNFFGGPVLYCSEFDLSSPTTTIEAPYPIRFFPNPCTKELQIDYLFETTTFFYSSSGQLILSSTEKTINTSMLRNGFYWIRIEDRHRNTLKNDILVKM